MLPDVDGFEICRFLRAHDIDTPILLLTARDAVDDRVRGLDTGADDYLVKPFAFAEFAARIRALQRLSSCAPRGGAGARPAPARRRLRPSSRSDGRRLAAQPPGVRGAPHPPRPPRQAVVERETLLEEGRGHPVHRAELSSTSTSGTCGASSRCVTDRIVIETVRGVGYRLVEARMRRFGLRARVVIGAAVSAAVVLLVAMLIARAQISYGR